MKTKSEILDKNCGFILKILLKKNSFKEQILDAMEKYKSQFNLKKLGIEDLGKYKLTDLKTPVNFNARKDKIKRIIRWTVILILLSFIITSIFLGASQIFSYIGELLFQHQLMLLNNMSKKEKRLKRELDKVRRKIIKLSWKKFDEDSSSWQTLYDRKITVKILEKQHILTQLKKLTNN